MTQQPTWSKVTRGRSQRPATPVIVEASGVDAVEIAHHDCLLCASGTDHVLGVARSRST